MTSRARQEILDEFCKLLDKKPIEKITVSEISAACGISRNTFYYHYSDVYALVEEMYRIDQMHLETDVHDVATVEQGLREAVHMAVEHEQALRHIYDSPGRDRLMAHLHKSAEVCVNMIIDAQAEGRKVSQEDKKQVAYLFGCLTEGIIADVMRSGKELDVDAIVTGACKYLAGILDFAFENSESN